MGVFFLVSVGGGGSYNTFEVIAHHDARHSRRRWLRFAPTRSNSGQNAPNTSHACLNLDEFVSKLDAQVSNFGMSS